jgi:hypothetical protein
MQGRKEGWRMRFGGNPEMRQSAETDPSCQKWLPRFALPTLAKLRFGWRLLDFLV